MEKEDKLKVRRKLPDKEFKIRDSILTKMFEDKNVSCVLYFALFYFVFLAIRNALEDVLYDGRSQFGFRMIIIAFGKFDLCIIGWIWMYLIHVSVYYGFRVWAAFRDVSKIWNIFWATAAFLAFFGTFHYMARYCFRHDLPIASRTILLSEQIRLIMKGYAFVRTNISYLGDKSFKSPTISHFVYFSFAPTLVYRNEYPRSPHRSWFKVFKYFSECFMYIYFMSLIEYEHFMKPLADFGKQPFGVLDIIYLMLKHALPSFIFCMLLPPCCMLHSTQNAFAEMLRFGDREFYSDWWTAINVTDFYQKWNGLIQNWLYIYVYKDCYENVSPSKAVAKGAVMTVSIIIHEVVYLCIFEILILIFLAGMLVSLFPIVSHSSKIRMFLLFIGISLIYGLPHLEYFAKHNCKNPPKSLLYVPRLISCGF